ncbi:Oxygen regulatory protein NreC [Thermoflexales bacterium]|nr:Oxygen regulatory protein NreC [Thermoflexales bacterium]
MTTIHVLLADDHALVRAGLRALLERIPDVQVMAEAGDGRAALQLIGEYQPEVVLMDIAMTGLNGLEATARITQDFPEVRVIMLSMLANEEYVRQALRAGAAGYILKDAAVSELEVALKTVRNGDTYLSPVIAQRLAAYMERAGGTGRLLDRLTPRQREILQLIAERHTTQDIARLLNISPKTVETHRAQLMDRLGIYDVAGLVRYAIRVGLVAPDGL